MNVKCARCGKIIELSEEAYKKFLAVKKYFPQTEILCEKCSRKEGLK